MKKFISTIVIISLLSTNFVYGMNKAVLDSPFSANTSTSGSIFSGSNLATNFLGLVGWWTFDGKNLQQNVHDSSIAAHNGWFVNFAATSSVVAPGKIGQALTFNGRNSFVNIGTFTDYALTEMTVSAWVNSTSTLVRQTIASNTNGAGAAVWLFELGRTAGKASFVQAGGSGTVTITCNTTLKKNVWNHIAITRKGASPNWTFVCYLNGVNDGTFTGSSTLTTNQNTAIGALSNAGITGSFFFSGMLDDVRVYNRPLADNEIKQVYNYGLWKLKKNYSKAKLKK